LAIRCHAPLVIAPVRKMVSAAFPELAYGVVDADGETLIDPSVAESLGVSLGEREAERIRVRREIRLKLTGYGESDPGSLFAGRPVLLVDDGTATGLTMAGAVRYARRHGATKVVVATPCIHPLAVARLQQEADRLVALVTDPHFVAVGNYYDDFSPVSDEQVLAILREARSLPTP
jgi:predicted phosphoribosyltransferase